MLGTSFRLSRRRYVYLPTGRRAQGCTVTVTSPGSPHCSLLPTLTHSAVISASEMQGAVAGERTHREALQPRHADRERPRVPVLTFDRGEPERPRHVHVLSRSAALVGADLHLIDGRGVTVELDDDGVRAARSPGTQTGHSPSDPSRSPARPRPRSPPAVSSSSSPSPHHPILLPSRRYGPILRSSRSLDLTELSRSLPNGRMLPW